jgi:alpha-aminoadipate carrier protein LysW
MAVTCPECDSPVDIDETDVDVGDEMSCAECGALIRVASESPLELELADEDDEDLDDDDDEADDDEDEDDEDEDEEGEDWGDDKEEE